MARQRGGRTSVVAVTAPARIGTVKVSADSAPVGGGVSVSVSDVGVTDEERDGSALVRARAGARALLGALSS